MKLISAILLAQLGLVVPQTRCGTWEFAVPLWRAYRGGDHHDHFYTTDYDELQRAIRDDGYKNEGNIGYIFSRPTFDTDNLYRLFHRKARDHYYTTSAAERDTAIRRDGYEDEGVIGYVYKTAVSCPYVAPLYRAYDPKGVDHFYTLSLAEKDDAVKNSGYKDEGIAAWILNAG